MNLPSFSSLISSSHYVSSRGSFLNALGSFAHEVRKIIFPFRVAACVKRSDDCVCLFTLSKNLFSWLGIKYSINMHVYTRSITLTPDARNWSGDRAASGISPHFASFSMLAWSHHHSLPSPLTPWSAVRHTHTLHISHITLTGTRVARRARAASLPVPNEVIRGNTCCVGRRVTQRWYWHAKSPDGEV